MCSPKRAPTCWWTRTELVGSPGVERVRLDDGWNRVLDRARAELASERPRARLRCELRAVAFPTRSRVCQPRASRVPRVGPPSQSAVQGDLVPGLPPQFAPSGHPHERSGKSCLGHGRWRWSPSSLTNRTANSMTDASTASSARTSPVKRRALRTLAGLPRSSTARAIDSRVPRARLSYSGIPR